MDLNKEKIKVLGKRVQVRKERIDSGGMKITPADDEEGLKNSGTIICVGQVGFLARLRGIAVGKKIHFKKYFIPNTDAPELGAFVSVEDIIAISK